MSYWYLWGGSILAGYLLVIGSGESIGAEAGNDASLPNYGWVVTESKIIVEEEGSVFPTGLTRAQNGDLLMAVASGGRTIILRSADQGHNWSQQGILKHQEERLGTGSTHGLCALRSGRLVMTYWKLAQELTPPVEHKWRFTRLESVQRGVYSDDEGKTWHYTPEMDISPFLSFEPYGCGPIFEDDDGTLVCSFRGHLSQAELDTGITSNGIVRSHDSGLTWGDASILYRGVPGSYEWFNENAVLPLLDGRWLAMSRCNYTDQPGRWVRDIYRMYTADKGRSWSKPVKTGFYGGELLLLTLPDGGVLCVWAHTNPFAHLDEGEPIGVYYAVSYDGGLTWSERDVLYRRPEERSWEHVGTPAGRLLDNETAIVVYHCGHVEHGDRGQWRVGASWLRKVRQ